MKLQRKYMVIAAFAVIAAAALLAVRALRDTSAKEGAETVRLAPVVLVARGPLENIISLSGEFRPFQEVDVHAKVAGYIQKMFVDVGDKVRALSLIHI